MGGQLIDGEWVVEKEWDQNERGQFERQPTRFHDRVVNEPDARFVPEAKRYHLYVSYACPWAHRTLIVRELKGLNEAISISVVHPYMGDDGWHFSDEGDCIPDTVNQSAYLRDVYLKADPDCTGRVTVPVLWDRKHETIVNNESRQIIRMFDTTFGELGRKDVDLYPAGYEKRIDEVMDAIYEPINNGVYRAGFAGTQAAYEEAVEELFASLDQWERVLGEHRYLCGDRLTEADVCMFTTLLRFDAVYYVHFKCNLRRIVDYHNLWNYLKELYQLPGVARTCSMQHIKRHYYQSHPHVNPTRFVPKGPFLQFNAPHDRERLSGGPPMGVFQAG